MTSLLRDDSSEVIGLLLALGIGLLIGLERERRKGEGPDRRAAGIRSFALVAVSGALAQLLSEPGLVAVGGVLVVLLAAISHFKGRSNDPGLTTELALFFTYLVGVLAVVEPLLGAACGAALALLLHARIRLHLFATQVLTEQELHDGLLLCAAALIVLPLIPNRSLAWLREINPRPLVAIVVLILTLQAVSHVAVRWLGPRVGLVAAGLLAGFASSTAAIASLGRQVRKQPERAGLLAAAAAWSTAATWVLAMLIGRRVIDRCRPCVGADGWRRVGVHAGGLRGVAGLGAHRYGEGPRLGSRATRSHPDSRGHRTGVDALCDHTGGERSTAPVRSDRDDVERGADRSGRRSFVGCIACRAVRQRPVATRRSDPRCAAGHHRKQRHTLYGRAGNRRLGQRAARGRRPCIRIDGRLDGMGLADVMQAHPLPV